MYRRLAEIALLFFALPVPAAQWCSSDDESSLRFETTFEGERLPGKFGNFDVRFDFDPARPQAGSLEVEVDLGAADLGDPEMNAVLHDPVWLDAADDSRAVFRSESIRSAADSDFIADGVLDLKGNKRRVSVAFGWEQSDGLASMKGGAELMRTDFDVGTGEWATGEAIGLTVRLEFDVTLEHCD